MRRIVLALTVGCSACNAFFDLDELECRPDACDAASSSGSSGGAPGASASTSTSTSTSVGSAVSSASSASSSASTASSSGAGGEGSGGEGGSTGGAPASSSASAGGDGGGGPEPCPAGCSCEGSCPLRATRDDCDADGDPAASDCHDCNALVFSGQEEWFDVPHDPPGPDIESFDYDCDGDSDLEYPFDSGGCGAMGSCVSDLVFVEPPSCGEPVAYSACEPRGVVLPMCADAQSGVMLARCH
jgi:hypothetical protein